MQHLEQKDAEHIIKTLCDNMVGDNENLRDISRTGLKTIIAGLPSSSIHLTKMIGENVIERLTEVAKKRSDLLVQLKVLTSRPPYDDIPSDLLSKIEDQVSAHFE